MERPREQHSTFALSSIQFGICRKTGPGPSRNPSPAVVRCWGSAWEAGLTSETLTVGSPGTGPVSGPRDWLTRQSLLAPWAHCPAQLKTVPAFCCEP